MDPKRCPGQDQRYWKPEDVFQVACPGCGAEIEFWKDEPFHLCAQCRMVVRNPRMDFGCAKWCKSAEECLGEERGAPVRAAALCDRLIAEMKAVFADDARLIDHTLQVLEYARHIQAVEGGDAQVIQAAAILHDIGIPEALRKHGAATGIYQEREGPDVAGPILAGVGVAPEAAEHVCRIIGAHHSGCLDTPEFDVVWDADWLVNFPVLYPELSSKERATVIHTTLRTRTGRALALERYAPGEKGCP